MQSHVIDEICPFDILLKIKKRSIKQFTDLFYFVQWEFIL